MSETTQRDHLHMFDDDLQALARRNYQGGMPIELLSDAYLFEAVSYTHLTLPTSDLV